MYLPKYFEETRTTVLHDLVQTHPLGVWVVLGEGELVANHIPFLIDRSRGPLGTLVGHVARANPVWKLPTNVIPSLVCFQGPQAYISPSWYPSKQEHGKVVPTWNYAVVHAHGTPRFIEDRDWLLKLVTRLTLEHEAGQAAPWRVEDAPADFVEGLLGAIIGVEIPISRLEGKWKVSQNRGEEDRAGVVAGLTAKGNEAAIDLARLVRDSMA